MPHPYFFVNMKLGDYMAITIKLYNTSDANNVICKTLEDETTVTDVRFKQSTDIMNPTLALKLDSYPNFNYCYIEEFSRYYFIDSITVTPNNVYEVELSIDVLESWKDDILNSVGYVTKSSNSNPYYNAGYASEVKKGVSVYSSNVTIERAQTQILVTVGGV